MSLSRWQKLMAARTPDGDRAGAAELASRTEADSFKQGPRCARSVAQFTVPESAVPRYRAWYCVAAIVRIYASLGANDEIFSREREQSQRACLLLYFRRLSSRLDQYDEHQGRVSRAARRWT